MTEMKKPIRALIRQRRKNMRFGMDFLGATKYPKIAVKNHPKGWAFGFFYHHETASGKPMFGGPGSGRKLLQRICNSGKAPMIRIQILWDDLHKFSDANIPVVIQCCKEIEAIAKQFPSIEFQVSPFCEHGLQNPDKYLRIVAEHAPSCIPLNVPSKSPKYNGATSRNFKNESHGYDPALKGNYNYSFDGTACVDADVQGMLRKHAKAEWFFFWTSQFNGRRNPLDNTPRPERKFWPVPMLIKSVEFLSTPKGKPSLPSDIRNRVLGKSHGDQHDIPPDQGELKPLILMPKNRKYLELVTDSGKVVARSEGAQNYVDGRFRYYFSSAFGYEHVLKAQRMGQKRPDLIVRTDRGEVIGRWNPAFRENEYRA